MVESIAKTLGTGSGVDTAALVTSLVEAQFAAKSQQVTKRSETLTAQVSAVSNLKSGITGFATALTNLVKSGSLSTAPSSSNTTIVRAAALAGAKLSALSMQVEVRSLASAQVAATKVARPAGEAIGTGTIQLRFGAYGDGGVFQPDPDLPVPPAITIGSTDGTLTGIAAKINAAAQGVTASIITEGTKERLVLKGPSGAERAFTLTATDDAGAPGLAAAVNVGAGASDMEVATAATDAVVAVDGVAVRRPTNSIDDLVPGVRLDLQSAQPGTRVTLGSTPPIAALSQAINDVVATYNELFSVLRAATDPATGSLARDPGATEMKRALAKLTLTDLTGAAPGSPKTLAEIGVATNRDGTLSVDAAKLTRALQTNPEAVEAMFTDTGTGATGKGLSAAMNAISSQVTSRTFGLGASEYRYTQAQSKLSTEKTTLSEQQEKMKTRLTQQYASMDARVAVYKSTQAFLTQQIDAWNRD